MSSIRVKEKLHQNFYSAVIESIWWPTVSRKLAESNHLVFLSLIQMKFFGETIQMKSNEIHFNETCVITYKQQML